MKYCSKCGNQLNDDANFCSKCGAPCNDVSFPTINTTVEAYDFTKYYGLTFKDIFGKVIELTPRGVVIYRHKSFLATKFDNLIPYKHIRTINLKRPSLGTAGFMSIITAGGGGLTIEELSNPSPKTASIIGVNENTVGFNHMRDIEPIYNALLEIQYHLN